MQSLDGTGKMGYNAGNLAVDLIDLGLWGCSADGGLSRSAGGRDDCWLSATGYMYYVDIARSLFSSKSRSTMNTWLTISERYAHGCCIEFYCIHSTDDTYCCTVHMAVVGSLAAGANVGPRRH